MTGTETTDTIEVTEEHRVFQVVVDNDFLGCTAIFVVVMTVILGIGFLWGTNLDNRSDEKRDRIDACSTIEVAAEKTLCLDKN